jgi:hypothetical protein
MNQFLWILFILNVFSEYLEWTWISGSPGIDGTPVFGQPGKASEGFSQSSPTLVKIILPGQKTLQLTWLLQIRSLSSILEDTGKYMTDMVVSAIFGPSM